MLEFRPRSSIFAPRERTRFRKRLFATAMCLMVVGCGKSSPSASAPRSSDGAEQPRAAAQPSPEDKPYRVEAVKKQSYAVNREDSFQIQVKPVSPWHMNDTFPAKVTFGKPEGLVLAEPVLRKADATRFVPEGARFDVRFTPERAGVHRLVAKVDFAVCTDEACLPVDQNLDVKLHAQ